MSEWILGTLLLHLTQGIIIHTVLVLHSPFLPYSMIGVVLMMRSAGFIMLLVVLVLCALWSRCGKVKCAVGKTTVEKRKGGLSTPH
jgi:hypothetical protein